MNRKNEYPPDFELPERGAFTDEIPLYELTNSLYSPDTDPEGSYTGVPEEKDSQPVQDADDL